MIVLKIDTNVDDDDGDAGRPMTVRITMPVVVLYD